jgi:glycerol kinase
MGVTVQLIDRRGRIIRRGHQRIRQIYPRPGRVEHDPLEIWRAASRLIRRVGQPVREIEAVGIANQRSTFVLWDLRTGKPVHNAIVWQDVRTADMCGRMRARGLEPGFRRKTGLLLDPYFAGTKIRWLVDNIRSARAKLKKGRLAFGTIDSWLLWNMTGEHATDLTNASRTMLFNINRKKWSDDLRKMLGFPRGLVLPRVLPSTARFGAARRLGGAPVHGVAGDQQAALYGQLCHRPGMSKNTYGTGCFFMANTGPRRPATKRLLVTLACDARGGPAYAVEGSVFAAGSGVEWMARDLKFLEHAGQSERMARRVEDAGGVYLVPAFAGLGAPYWDMAARGAITGLRQGIGPAHIVRAALEAIAYRTRDVIDAVEEDLGLRVRELRADGAVAVNDLLMQFQADILGRRVVRPANIDSTALGAAFLAGVGAGFWSPAALRRLVRIGAVFRPERTKAEREDLYAGWKRAVAAVRTV